MMGVAPCTELITVWFQWRKELLEAVVNMTWHCPVISEMGDHLWQVNSLGIQPTFRRTQPCIPPESLNRVPVHPSQYSIPLSAWIFPLNFLGNGALPPNIFLEPRSAFPLVFFYLSRYTLWWPIVQRTTHASEPVVNSPTLCHPSAKWRWVSELQTPVRRSWVDRQLALGFLALLEPTGPTSAALWTQYISIWNVLAWPEQRKLKLFRNPLTTSFCIIK